MGFHCNLKIYWISQINHLNKTSIKNCLSLKVQIVTDSSQIKYSSYNKVQVKLWEQVFKNLELWLTNLRKIKILGKHKKIYLAII